MTPRTKEGMIKKLRKECEKLSKLRDNLYELHSEIEAQLDGANEASELLEACIDKLSELN